MKAILFSIILSFSISARLLDKIVAVIDDQIITLSQVKRIGANLSARSQISPVIFNKRTAGTHAKIIDIILHKYMIRKKLADMGYRINDDQVESQIKGTEAKLGLQRKDLLNFLKGNGMSFDEYFELIRETIEFNIFNERVIRPLISVTEQEVKNAFFKETASNNSLTFKYTLVDYSIDNSAVRGVSTSGIHQILRRYQVSGNLPAKYKGLNQTTLDNIKGDSLSKSLRKILKDTDEGAITKKVLLGDQAHYFLIKKKDLTESEFYTKNKNRIRGKLFAKSAAEITKLWFDRNRSGHYIKLFN